MSTVERHLFIILSAHPSALPPIFCGVCVPYKIGSYLFSKGRYEWKFDLDYLFMFKYTMKFFNESNSFHKSIDFHTLSTCRLPRQPDSDSHCHSSDFQSSYSRFMSMSYSHYFKSDSHDRVYEADATLQRNYGYPTSSFGPVSPHGVSVKQEPRDFNFENGM